MAAGWVLEIQIIQFPKRDIHQTVVSVTTDPGHDASDIDHPDVSKFTW